MFGSIIKAVRAVGGAVASVGRTASKIPGVGAIPIVGNALALAGGAATISSFLGGGGSSGMPALPNLAGGPLMPGGMNPLMGDRGIFQNDPNIPDFLKPFAISKTNLKQYFRGPRGTVIVHDEVGDPYALDRKLAIRFKLWRPGHKPPISVGDWQAVKKADRTVKKMKKVFRVTTSVDKHISGGKVVVSRRKKGRG